MIFSGEKHSEKRETKSPYLLLVARERRVSLKVRLRRSGQREVPPSGCQGERL